MPNRNRKYLIITKKCPVCYKEFETKLGHRDEKTCCSISCSNTYQPKRKNYEYKYNKEDIKELISESQSYIECVRKSGKKVNGGNVELLKRYVKKYNISVDHFKHSPGTTGKAPYNKMPLETYMTENSTYGRSSLKKRMYEEGLKERKCEICGQDEEWNGRKMSLILDHINGVNNDHRKENLRIVCPNCNATLETHCKSFKNTELKPKNTCIDCGSEIGRKSERCKKCRFNTDNSIQ